MESSGLGGSETGPYDLEGAGLSAFEKLSSSVSISVVSWREN